MACYFIHGGKLNIHIATIDEKRHLNIHPTWYYFDATKNKIYVETAKSSKKVENLNRNNLIYYCVDIPYMPYKGVIGKGRVRIHEDINYNIPIAKKIMVGYLGSLAHPIATSLMNTVRNGDSVTKIEAKITRKAGHSLIRKKEFNTVSKKTVK